MKRQKVRNWKSSTPNRDTGCADAGVSSCLVCPLPVCVEEMTASELAAFRLRKRDGDVLRQMRDRGLSVNETARHFDLTERTVWRILARSRDVVNEMKRDD